MKALLLFFFLGIFTIVSGQRGFFINDNAAVFTMKKNSLLYVDGDFQHLKSDPGFQAINGEIRITKDFIVNREEVNFERPETNYQGARLTFVGNTDSRIIQLNSSAISDTVKIKLNQLIVDKSTGDLYIDNNVSVRDSIFFIKGNIILDSIARVFFDLSLGTNSVKNNPFIVGENAQKQFKGKGFLYSKYLVSDSMTENQFNTGLYLNTEQSKLVEFYRGHIKQLYAGNGSIDRFFDISITDTITHDVVRPDSVSIRYLPDVDYLSMGVDPARLGVYISKQFQDNDFIRIKNIYTNHYDSVSITDTSVFSHPIVNLQTMKFRITLADTLCSEYPQSNLPDSVVHLCSTDSLNVIVFQTNSSLLSQNCYWDDDSFHSDRTFYPLTVPQEIGVEIYNNKGCFIRDTLKIAKVAPNPKASFSYNASCTGDSTEFKNTSVIASGSFSSTWIFDGSSSYNSGDSLVYHIYNTAGTHPVKLQLISNYGCKADTVINIPSFNPPQAVVNYDFNCYYQAFTFDASQSIPTTIPSVNNISSYSWSLDQVPVTSAVPDQLTLSQLTPGAHTVSLTIGNGLGCIDSVQQNFIVYPTDTARIHVYNGCINTPLTIENNSIVLNSNAHYKWKFSDGSTYNQYIPNKTFTTSGIKTATLYIYADDFCIDSVSVAFQIFANPSADFIVTASACQNEQINFTPSGTINTSSQYHWEFGDGVDITQINPQHNYTTAGSKSVTLNVTDINGCIASRQKTILIHSKPAADFVYNEVCYGTPTNFNSSSLGNNLNYQWNFGGTGSSTLLNTSYLFSSAGNHNVQLIVTDEYQCKDTIAKNVPVKSLPAFGASQIQTCGASYTLDATTPNASYLWNPGNITSPIYTVTQTGNYTLQITSADGCSKEFPISVTLNSALQPNLGSDASICESTTLNTGIFGADYLWNDGSSDAVLYVNQPGIYWVEVTDQNGCSGFDTIQIYQVYQKPVIDLGQDITLCKSETPYVLSAGNYTTYQWQNGSNSSEFQVIHTGNYHVLVTDHNGCTDSDTISISINENPLSNLTGTSVSSCGEYTVIAGNNSNYNYSWSDGGTGAVKTLTSSGAYILTITNPSNNCFTADTINVIINQIPSIELGADITVCSNTPVTFDYSQTGYIFEWSSTSNAIVSSSPVFTPSSSDLYTVFVRTPQGCEASDAVSVTFLPSPVIPNHAPLYYICGETPVQLQGSLFGINSWSSNIGFNSSSQNISVFETGTYYLTASVNNCISRDTFELVTSPQQISAFYLVDTDTTKNLTLQFIDLSEPSPSSYLWNFGDGTTDTVANPVHVYVKADTYMSSLTVSNGYCYSTYKKEIKSKAFYVQPEYSPVVYSLDFENVNLYPNPAETNAFLSVSLNDKASTVIALYNHLGQLIQHNNFEDTKKIELTYDLHYLSAGFYHITIVSESMKGRINKHFKLVKVN